ncbi:MAG: SagB/ThcOx family dehydrogenase [bacterium]|nr:SagB/ThcOx family dehydrogenase [bacterium]
MKRKRKPQVGQEFMRKTQFKFLDPTGQAQGMMPPPIQLGHHPGAPVIGLPDPSKIEVTAVDLKAAIEARKSVRDFLEGSLTLEQVAFLLWCTQGVKEVEQIETFRTVPSAGARHPFETYLVVNHVEDLEPGLYRYIALQHHLLPVNLEDGMGDRIAETCLQPDLIQTSALTFIWTAVALRTTWRYGDRGYRYIHLDAGHVGQNLYLAAQAVECGVCTSAAFNDDELNRVLGIDGTQHFAVYFGSVGK